MQYASRVKFHVYERGNMPLAKIVYDAFWGSNRPTLLANFLDAHADVIVLGRTVLLGEPPAHLVGARHEPLPDHPQRIERIGDLGFTALGLGCLTRCATSDRRAANDRAPRAAS